MEFAGALQTVRTSNTRWGTPAPWEFFLLYNDVIKELIQFLIRQPSETINLNLTPTQSLTLKKERMENENNIWLSAFTSSPTTTKPTAHISFITGIVVCFPSKLAQHMIEKKVPTSQACDAVRPSIAYRMFH